MDRETLLNAIRKYLFYTVELNLYLDTHKDCSQAEKDYKAMSDKLNKLICEYESNFGQLQNFGLSTEMNSCSWCDDPWPWEKENNRGCCR